ncbi:cytochrome P450 [Macrolepiota fuliginosa MF-IS2]|uniref:Cytochrome P450 n=1 Tax=Macrolepiota fuliginosa MF-IS2 TaxID=1400762 RepID=A0A9P6C1T3_9AGAR|nr:cytochrome P450 [Macrolepiota fuliginosa MF-IS2]
MLLTSVVSSQPMLGVTVSKTICTFLITLAIWRLLRRFIIKSAFDNLPGPPSRSWLFGNIPQLFTPNGWNFHHSILKRYGRAIKLRGVLGEQLLVTFDPKALHYILVKDQHIYEGSSAFIERNRQLLGEGLLSTRGEQHRKQKKMLNPVFSINHMREMSERTRCRLCCKFSLMIGSVPLFYEVTERLRATLKTKLANGPQEIDALHWMTRTALELIGQSGMGYSFDNLSGDDDIHPYSVSVKKFVPLGGGPVGFLVNQFVFPFAIKFNFPRLKRFLVECLPFQRAREFVKVIDVMHHTSIEIINAKKKALTSPNPEVVAEMMSKKDIISILMKANVTASKQDQLSDEEVLGQVSEQMTTFVFAGMDTTSSALSRTLWLLATHQDVQQRLREEIRGAQEDGQLSYDQLVSLPYLDAVCRETLRVYPPINLAPMRMARQDMILPFSKPIFDSTGKQVSEVFIPAGTNIIISVLGANCNPDLWGPDSYEWKPERWLSPLPKAVEDAHMPGIYSHLMTFLGGGRACIGFKFSQLEMKVVLSVLLSSFKFAMAEKEISWKMNGIAGPTVAGEDEMHPQLPLLMRLVE